MGSCHYYKASYKSGYAPWVRKAAEVEDTSPPWLIDNRAAPYSSRTSTEDWNASLYSKINTIVCIELLRQFVDIAGTPMVNRQLFGLRNRIGGMQGSSFYASYFFYRNRFYKRES